MKLIPDYTVEEQEDPNSAYLIFSVNNLHYAVKSSHVLKIVEIKRITSLVRMPPYILGVTKIYDNIYSVMDLRIRFGCEHCMDNHPNTAILLTYNGLKLCAIVDKVISVKDIDADGPEIPKWVNPYVSKVIQTAGMVIGFLSIDCLFNMDETDTWNCLNVDD